MTVCPACCAMGTNNVKCCTNAAKAGQKSLVPAQRGLFHTYSLSTQLSQFQSAGATHLQSLKSLYVRVLWCFFLGFHTCRLEIITYKAWAAATLNNSMKLVSYCFLQILNHVQYKNNKKKRNLNIKRQDRATVFYHSKRISKILFWIWEVFDQE